MKKPKISVIMSVYNGMPYLKEAVQSILKQTFKDFEFIVVNDASTDDSWQYLKGLNDKRIKLIINEKNLGLATSLNDGIKIAKGNFIARMDADDVSKPDRLEVQYKFLTKNPEIDLCGSWADIIDEKGKIVAEKKYPVKNLDIKRVLSI